MEVWKGIWRLFLLEFFSARRHARVSERCGAGTRLSTPLGRFLRQAWSLLSRRVWMHCDRPVMGTEAIPVSGVVAVEGWALAGDGVASVTISCDDQTIGEAALGVRRRDLARLFPHIPRASRGGFHFVFDSRTVDDGEHTFSVAVLTRRGRRLRMTGPVIVQNGPSIEGNRRRRIGPTAAALAWMRRNIPNLPDRPRLSVLVPLQSLGEAAGVRRTVESLLDQSYSDWELVLIGREDCLTAADSAVRPDSRIQSVPADSEIIAELLNRAVEETTGELVTVLDPGDALSPVDLFEIVYSLNLRPELDRVLTQSAEDAPPRWAVRRKLAIENGGALQRAAGLEPAVWEHAAEASHATPPAQGRRLALHPHPVLTHSPFPLFDRHAVRRVLVVKLDHLGDVLLALPAVRRLRDLFPAAELTMLVGAWARKMVECEPAVDRVLTYDYYQASSVLRPNDLTRPAKDRIRSWLAPFDFDLAVDLRSETDTREFIRLSGAKRTAGFANRGECEWLTVALPCEGVDPLQPPRRHIAHEALRLVSLLEQLTNEPELPRTEPTADDFEAADRLLADVLPSGSRPLIGIHPGAGRPIKCWAAESFGQLAGCLAQRLGAAVIIFGGPEDELLANRVLRHAPAGAPVVSLAGRLSLTQFMAAIRRCDLFVGNDSGPTHLAGMAGIPTLGVYSGIANPEQWGPLGPNAAALHLPMLCSPCYLSNPWACPYKVACLRDIGVETVYEAALRMLLPKWGKMANNRPREVANTTPPSLAIRAGQ
jgi:ADP-heptose:LPS heptosyltransferase